MRSTHLILLLIVAFAIRLIFIGQSLTNQQQQLLVRQRGGDFSFGAQGESRWKDLLSNQKKQEADKKKKKMMNSNEKKNENNINNNNHNHYESMIDAEFLPAPHPSWVHGHWFLVHDTDHSEAEKLLPKLVRSLSSSSFSQQTRNNIRKSSGEDRSRIDAVVLRDKWQQRASWGSINTDVYSNLTNLVYQLRCYGTRVLVEVSSFLSDTDVSFPRELRKDPTNFVRIRDNEALIIDREMDGAAVLTGRLLDWNSSHVQNWAVQKLEPVLRAGVSGLSVDCGDSAIASLSPEKLKTATTRSASALTPSLYARECHRFFLDIGRKLAGPAFVTAAVGVMRRNPETGTYHSDERNSGVPPPDAATCSFASPRVSSSFGGLREAFMSVTHASYAGAGTVTVFPISDSVEKLSAKMMEHKKLNQQQQQQDDNNNAVPEERRENEVVNLHNIHPEAPRNHLTLPHESEAKLLGEEDFASSSDDNNNDENNKCKIKKSRKALSALRWLQFGAQLPLFLSTSELLVALVDVEEEQEQEQEAKQQQQDQTTTSTTAMGKTRLARIVDFLLDRRHRHKTSSSSSFSCSTMDYFLNELIPYHRQLTAYHLAGATEAFASRLLFADHIPHIARETKTFESLGIDHLEMHMPNRIQIWPSNPHRIQIDFPLFWDFLSGRDLLGSVMAYDFSSASASAGEKLVYFPPDSDTLVSRNKRGSALVRKEEEEEEQTRWYLPSHVGESSSSSSSSIFFSAGQVVQFENIQPDTFLSFRREGSILPLSFDWIGRKHKLESTPSPVCSAPSSPKNNNNNNNGESGDNNNNNNNDHHLVLDEQEERHELTVFSIDHPNSFYDKKRNKKKKIWRKGTTAQMRPKLEEWSSFISSPESEENEEKSQQRKEKDNLLSEVAISAQLVDFTSQEEKENENAGNNFKTKIRCSSVDSLLSDFACVTGLRVRGIESKREKSQQGKKQNNNIQCSCSLLSSAKKTTLVRCQEQQKRSEKDDDDDENRVLIKANKAHFVTRDELAVWDSLAESTLTRASSSSSKNDELLECSFIVGKTGTLHEEQTLSSSSSSSSYQLLRFNTTTSNQKKKETKKQNDVRKYDVLLFVTGGRGGKFWKTPTAATPKEEDGEPSMSCHC